MGEPLVITALRRKYAHLAGERAALKRRIREIDKALTQTAATIRLFDEGHDVSTIPALRYSARHAPPGRRFWTPRAIAILRAASAPMTAYDLAERVIAESGLTRTTKLAYSATSAIRGALKGRIGRGVTRHETEPYTWSVDSTR